MPRWWMRPASALAAAALAGCDVDTAAPEDGAQAPPSLGAPSDDTDTPEDPRSLDDTVPDPPAPPDDDASAGGADTSPFDPSDVTDDTDAPADPPEPDDTDTYREDTHCTGLLLGSDTDTGGPDTGGPDTGDSGAG